MKNLLPDIGSTAEFGLAWPIWSAVGGFALFCLLGLYAAILLVAGDRLPSRLRILQPPTLRGRMLVGFILVATLPAISLALVLSERTANDRLETTATIMTTQARSIAGIADFFLQRYVSRMGDAAQGLEESLPNTDLSASLHLLQAHRTLPGLQLMMIADTAGNLVAQTTADGQRYEVIDAPRPSVADKAFFQTPLVTGTSYISNGLTHPQIDADIAVAISIPISDDADGTMGVLIGFSDLRGFARTQSQLAEESGIRSLLLDSGGRVLFASELSEWSVGDELLNRSVLSAPYRGPGEIFNFDEQVGDTGDRERFLATGFTLRNDWQVYLYRPLDHLEAALLEEYAVALTWLVGALLISICLALALIKGLSGPLETLDESVRNFDLNLHQDIPKPPADAPSEFLTVFEHLSSLNERLRSSYRKFRRSVQQGEKLRGELIYVIANREKEIEKRTQELQEANETLQRLSREDSLTGLANRRWFAQFLARAWQSAMRERKPLCILIIDIDNFKAYNDTYGHHKGDDCLKLVADAIDRAVGRASDLVSRYGGEEFIVVLGDTPLEGGLKIAEHIRAAVENLAIPHQASPVHQRVTISIGVTSTLPSPDIQPETVLVAADRAMYNAKNDGRNKVAYSTTAHSGSYQSFVMPGDTTTRLS